MTTHAFKKIELISVILGIPSSLATIYQIGKWVYQKVGSTNMLPWIFIAIISIISIVVYIWATVNEKRLNKSNEDKIKNEKESQWKLSIENELRTIKSNFDKRLNEISESNNNFQNRISGEQGILTHLKSDFDLLKSNLNSSKR